MIRRDTYNSDSRRFSRQWWLGRGHTLFWVAIVTVLIWVFADLRFIGETPLTAVIQLNAVSNPNLVLLSDSDPPVQVSKLEVDISFIISGNRTALDRFREQLQERALQLRYDLSEHYRPGENLILIQAEDIVNRVLEPSKTGVTVVSTTPASVPVRVDHLISVEVPVEFAYMGGALSGDPQITPEKVAIRVAKSAWDRISQSGAPAPRLKTLREDLSKRPPGENEWKNLRLERSIGDVRVIPEPAAVTVIAEISQRDATREITVPVRVLCPLSWTWDDTWRDYDLVLEDPSERQKTIKITGPKKDIDRLDPAKDVEAFIVPREEDKEGSRWTGKVEIRFREGFRLKLVGENPTVVYKLERRSAAPM